MSRRAEGRGPGRDPDPVPDERRHGREVVLDAGHALLRVLAVAAAARTSSSCRCSTASTSGCPSTRSKFGVRVLDRFLLQLLSRRDGVWSRSPAASRRRRRDLVAAGQGGPHRRRCCRPPSPTTSPVVVSWLSGELPQRQIGVGWAALRSLPAPAAEPSLTVARVHETLHRRSARPSGRRLADAPRASCSLPCSPRRPRSSRPSCARLLGGELRQGALLGVMTDAIAKAAGRPARRGAPRGDAARRPARGRRAPR